MSKRALYYLGAGVGSFIGSVIPGLWGAGLISGSAIFLSTVGGIAGIWAVYKFL